MSVILNSINETGKNHMPEINHFATSANDNLRKSEICEDHLKLLQDAFLGALHFNAICGKESHLVAKEQGQEIFNKACNALLNNNIHEAVHQLHREIDFCHLSPILAKSPLEVSARAGLIAIKEHKNAIDVYHTMQEVWLKTWAGNPKFFDLINQ